MQSNTAVDHHSHPAQQNDRLNLATQLFLSLPDFERMLESAEKAYNVFKELGPFYGREEVKDPTYRVTAEPVTLPKGSRKKLENLGDDLFHLARALKDLPENFKKRLAPELDFNVPPTWRVDAILDKRGRILVNEVEGQDGATALIMAEQLAYDLQSLTESTAAKLIETLKAMFPKSVKQKIAHIRVDILNNPHSVNAERYIKFIDLLSQGQIKLEHLNETTLRSGEHKPDWSLYTGVISECSFSPEELLNLGIKPEQLILTGNYNALVNKAVFALVFEDKLKDYWLKTIGKTRLERLKKILIPTKLINSLKDLDEARKAGKVVKASWAGKNTTLINRSKGVAMPTGDLEQSTDERWKLLKDMYREGVKLVAQDYVEPAQIKAYLRKRGTTLEKVEWYNRVAIKYVVAGDPKNPETEKTTLTGTEVTLGPDVIPAGRSCAFTAGKFVD